MKIKFLIPVLVSNTWWWILFELEGVGIFDDGAQFRSSSATSIVLFPRDQSILAYRRHGHFHGHFVHRVGQRLARIVESLWSLFISRLTFPIPISKYKTIEILSFTFGFRIDHKVWSCLLTHGAGLIILSLCYCAHSILVRGVYLDAEEPGAAAAALPYYYTRYFVLVCKFQLNSIWLWNEWSWIEFFECRNGDGKIWRIKRLKKWKRRTRIKQEWKITGNGSISSRETGKSSKTVGWPMKSWQWLTNRRKTTINIGGSIKTTRNLLFNKHFSHSFQKKKKKRQRVDYFDLAIFVFFSFGYFHSRIKKFVFLGFIVQYSIVS